MNQETRIAQIEAVIEQSKDKPFGSQEIPWKNQLTTMNVYQIPLDCLVYNKYNGRILSRTKSLEKQGHQIDEESPEGKAIIEKLLWDSKPDRNKKTEKSLREFGQERIGIITRDGIIIDGNRRAMLLNKIGKGYFKAVVLPVKLSENPIAIEELETRYQLGEDEKLTYNATEKYLKTKELYLRLTGRTSIDINNFEKSSIQKISDWMGENKSEIEKYLRTMYVMDDYLNVLKIDGLYTQLDDREDQFLFLQKWLGNFYGEENNRGFDGYSDDDVDDLKLIAIDFIRIRQNYDGKEFRIIADGNRENHFFGDKKIWRSFCKRHFEIRDSIADEPDIDFESADLQAHLKARDTLYFNKSKNGSSESQFLENLNYHKTLIGNNKAAEEPAKLVRKAIDAIDAIKPNHKAFSTPEVQDMLNDLSGKVFGTLESKSPLRALNQILEMIIKIQPQEVPEQEIAELVMVTKKISQACYRLEKKL